MEIEGFNEIIGIITLAKELYDIGRYDIVQQEFFDTLCYDSYCENMLGAIMSVFSGFHSDYDDSNETESMVFTDDVINNYFCLAYEHGRKYKLSHNENPYVMEAEHEVRKWLNFCFSIDWKLLAYTKSKRTARKRKLVVYTSAYEFCEHDYLAYGLIQLHKWFSDKCEEFVNKMEVMAA